MNRQVRRQQWLQFNSVVWFQKHKTGRERRYLFIIACTALQAVHAMVVVISLKTSLQVTREELLIKAVGKPGRCAAFLLARMIFL